jgi:hypothetical protein
MGGFLRIAGWAYVAACLLVPTLRSSPPVAFEVTAAKPMERVVLSNASKGSYWVFLAYDADTLPKEVVTNFLNWKFPPRTNWNADLHISLNRVCLVSNKITELRPAVLSGRKLCFRVGEFEIGKPGRLEISLSSIEERPFGGISAWLSVQPNPLCRETYALLNLICRVFQCLCIPVFGLLLFDYLSSCRSLQKK